MIWQYFPVGMSFPVSDFSEGTKRKCWQTALSALAATEQENRTEMILYDSCVENIPGSADKEYVCVLYHKSVKQTRVNLPLWREMGVLTASLSLHYPFYQANALDGFGPYIELGSVQQDGSYVVTEEGKNILPKELPAPLEKQTGPRIVIALPAAKDAFGYAHAMKQIGKAAAELNKKTIYCPLPSGSIGTAYACTYALRGRFEWLEIAKDAEKQLIGIIPDRTVISDLAALPANPENTSVNLGRLIRKILDLGYRNMIFAVDGYSETDRGEGFQQVLCEGNPEETPDTRLLNCRITLLTKQQIPAGGVFQKLRELGAEVLEASDFFENRTHALEQISSADILITNEIYAKKLSHPRNRVYTVSEQEMKEPELLYRIFSRKLAQRGE